MRQTQTAQSHFDSASAAFNQAKSNYERCMGNQYCNLYSSVISICCNSIAVVGYTQIPVAKVVSVGATLISAGNAYVYATLCAVDVSAASSALDETVDLLLKSYAGVKVKIACNVVDMIVNVKSIAQSN